MILINDISQKIIKDVNKKKIFDFIRNKKCTIKTKISEELGLSVPTVAAHVNEFIELGLVKESGMASSTGGRPPIRLEFVPNAYYCVGVDINDSNIKLAIMDLDYKIIETEIISYDDKSSSFYGLSPKEKDIGKILTKINKWINLEIVKLGIEKNQILGIGFSFHGIVDKNRQTIKFPFKEKWLTFKDYANLLDWKAVIENEANTSAIAESSIGIAKNIKSMVYLSINKGVGTGIVIKDYLYRGTNNKAGEFGHMVVQLGGRKCRCGQKGCLEEYSSVIALQNNYYEITSEKLDIEKIFELYNKGDKKAKEATDLFIKYLAVGIRNIILGVDPHYIVIGGEISKYSKYFIDDLRKITNSISSQFSEDDNIIIVSSLKDNSAVWGAAMLPIENIFSEIRNIKGD